MTLDKPNRNAKVGPIPICISVTKLADFCDATGFGNSTLDREGPIPLSYIPTLLGHDTVKPGLIEALQTLGHDGAEEGLLHLRQDVQMQQEMMPDEAYTIWLSCQRDEAGRVIISGVIKDREGRHAAQFETEMMRVSGKTII
ncbi:hypothetical protein [Cognatishimia activa]|uniref:hypothetical protein n=1 Tax=Cognatishimia activa TaxID=1715691 RepID=UPI00222E6858|nr:hypothetical protein [Cognatishimia activa]UZD90335.1 hypothetical protein M0D42_12160 [Cognatishimia activa]